MFTIDADKRIKLKALKGMEAATVTDYGGRSGSRWEPTEHFDVLRCVDRALRNAGLTPRFETTTEAREKVVAASVTFTEAGDQPVLAVVSGLNGRIPIRFYGGVRLADGTSILTCPTVVTLKHHSWSKPLDDVAETVAAACRAAAKDKVMAAFGRWRTEASAEKFGPVKATAFLDEFVGRPFDPAKICATTKNEIVAKLSEEQDAANGPAGSLFRFWWAFARAVSRGRPTYQLGRKMALLTASTSRPPEVWAF